MLLSHFSLMFPETRVFVTVSRHARCPVVSMPQFTIPWLPVISLVCNYGYSGRPCCEYTAPLVCGFTFCSFSCPRGPKLLNGKAQKQAGASCLLQSLTMLLRPTTVRPPAPAPSAPDITRGRCLRFGSQTTEADGPPPHVPSEG